MQFINSYAGLDEMFYERTSPAGFKNPELFLWNESLASQLNLPEELQQAVDIRVALNDDLSGRLHRPCLDVDDPTEDRE